MKRASILFVLVLCISAVGAGPIAQQTTVPRDTTGIETTLTAVNDAQTSYIAATDTTDQKRAAYDQALAELNQAIADEADARTALETAQAAYDDAYQQFPKEDTLAP